MRPSTGIAFILAAGGDGIDLAGRRRRPRWRIRLRTPRRIRTKTGASPPRRASRRSLGATNSGLRVLKHVGGSVPDSWRA